MEALLGKHGHSLYEYVHGLEQEPVRRMGDHETPKSIGRGRTFRRDLVGEEEIRVEILALCEDVAARLRQKGLRCWGVQLTIKDPQFACIDRQTQLEQPADTTGELYQGAMDVFGRAWHLGKPIRMMTVTAISLTQETRQLSLFDDGRGEKLARSVDQIRQKFGDGAIRPAALLGREE